MYAWRARAIFSIFREMAKHDRKKKELQQQQSEKVKKIWCGCECVDLKSDVSPGNAGQAFH